MRTPPPATRPADAGAAAMLAFARRQARPADVTDGDAVLADVSLPLGSRRAPLAAGLHRLLDRASVPPAPPAPELAALDAWQRVQLVLHCAFGAQRWEPTHPYNPHRAFPSPRCAFTTHAVLLDPSGGTWYFDPYGHELVAIVAGGAGLGAAGPAARAGLGAVGPAGGAPDSDASPAAEVARTGGATLAVLANTATLPPGYGDLRYPLALLEAGHALGAAHAVAAAAGLRPAVRLGFDDAAVLAATGADPADGWLALALLDLGTAVRAAAPAGRALAPRQGDPDGLAWLTGHAVDAWCRQCAEAPAAPAHGLAGDAPVPTPAPSPARPAGPPTLGRLLFERTAGRARTGASGRPEPLPAGATGDMLAAVADPPDLGLGHRPWAAGLRCLAVVERTEDLADGLYEWHPTGRELRLLQPGPLMGRVQEAFSYPAEWVRVDTFNQAWFLVADYGDVVARLGPRGFRVCQLEVGCVAQALGTAATASGAFARPCRSFHHDLLVSLLGLGPDETVAYEVLVGRNRFEDLLLDLRP